MAKNVSLSKQAYSLLSNEKRFGESFSDVILRLLSQKKRLADVTGKKLLSPNISLEEIRNAGKHTLDRLNNEST